MITKTKKNELYHNMIKRCYDKKYQERQKSYIGCKVCDNWLNDMYDFYDWVDDNYYEVPDSTVQLDKDILIKGNKIYSPEACIFAPRIINSTYSKKNVKPKYDKKSKKYIASITFDKKTVLIGEYNTEKEALKNYIKYKECAIKALAKRYKNHIPNELYNALMSYQIDLSDVK